MTSANTNQYEWGNLGQLLAGLKRISVLVIGDLMLDEYIYGNIERVSPEAPTGILDWRSRNVGLGGAANVANNLVGLGCDVHLTGVVGRDAASDELLQAIRCNGIDTTGIIAAQERPTTVKTRLISHGHHIMRIDRETRSPIEDAMAEAVLQRVRNSMRFVDGVILSDYAKGVLRPDVCAAIIEMAQRAGKLTVVDPKGIDYSKYKGAFLLTPNKKELAEAAHLPLHSESEIRQAAARVISNVGCKALAVTRGEEGMTVFQADGEALHIQSEVRDVFDVTGAGDTVVSMLGRVLFAGKDLEFAARLANFAAGLKVAKVGATPVKCDEIIAALDQKQQRAQGKIVDLEQLKRLVGIAHSQGRKVVLTNGCFDFLHAGHVQFLHRAKALGNLLVVAINDDPSVKKIKGGQRPLIQAADRVRIIAALESVDYVTVFSELTPLRLIEELRPDLLVKGGNYRLEEVVGRREVERYGGRVELIPLIEAQSTTQLIMNMAAGSPFSDDPSA